MESFPHFTRASQLRADQLNPQLQQPPRVVNSASGEKQHGHATMGTRQMVRQMAGPHSRKSAKQTVLLEQLLLGIAKTSISATTTRAERTVFAPTLVKV
jgi:hypothetical protein